MILVDKDIKEYVARKELIISGYNETNINGVSYDLTMDVAYNSDGGENRIYELAPGEVVFIKTQEKISIPNNILGRVGEKNSRMRNILCGMNCRMC